jgi:hypothetical protein
MASAARFADLPVPRWSRHAVHIPAVISAAACGGLSSFDRNVRNDFTASRYTTRVASQRQVPPGPALRSNTSANPRRSARVPSMPEKS